MRTSFVAALFASLILFAEAGFAVPGSMTVSGRLTKPDGTALTSNAVSLNFAVTNPSGTCVLYRETSSTLDLSASNGEFSFLLGTGVATYPTGTPVMKDYFKNSGTFTCADSSTYTPSADDVRKLAIQFMDQTETPTVWRSFTSSVPMNSVATALFADSATKLGDHGATDFLLNSLIPTCTTGSFLTWSGTALTCGNVTTSGGTVTAVSSASAALTVASGTSTPVLTLNVGTTSGSVAAGNDSRFASALQSGAVVGGDLSGSLTASSSVTVVGLRGTGVSASAPTSNQVLKFNGSLWSPGGISSGEVSGLSTTISTALAPYVTQTAFNAAFPSCTAAQTISWNSTTNVFSCQTIPSSGGTVTAVTSGNAALTVTSGTTTPALTLNVGTTSGSVAAGNDSRFASALQSGGTVTGDLSGTLTNGASAVTVTGLRGSSISTASPSAGQILKYSGSQWVPGGITTSDVSNLSTVLAPYMTQSAFNASVASVTSCTSAQTMYWSTVTGAFACQTIGAIPGVFVNGGNSQSADLSLGTNDAFGLGFKTGNTTRMFLDTNGNVGVGTTTPTAMLDLQGGAVVSRAKSSSTACINFLTGNVQVSSYATTNAISLGGLVNGGAYTLILTGYMAGQTVTFSAFTDAACTSAITTGVDFGGSNSGVVSSFTASGNTQVVTLIYSSSRGVVYASAATNYYK
jgi:hypothetical protein